MTPVNSYPLLCCCGTDTTTSTSSSSVTSSSSTGDIDSSLTTDSLSTTEDSSDSSSNTGQSGNTSNSTSYPPVVCAFCAGTQAPGAFLFEIPAGTFVNAFGQPCFCAGWNDQSYVIPRHPTQACTYETANIPCPGTALTQCCSLYKIMVRIRANSIDVDLLVVNGIHRWGWGTGPLPLFTDCKNFDRLLNIGQDLHGSNPCYVGFANPNPTQPRLTAL